MPLKVNLKFLNNEELYREEGLEEAGYRKYCGKTVKVQGKNCNTKGCAQGFPYPAEFLKCTCLPSILQLSIIYFWDNQVVNLKLARQQYRAWSECMDGSILVAKAYHFWFWKDKGLTDNFLPIIVFSIKTFCYIITRPIYHLR